MHGTIRQRPRPMRNLTERVTQFARRWPVLAGVAVYCAVTAVLGWRVLAHPSATIVHDVGDPLLTAALLHWNAWVVPFTHAWWQFPIFHPTTDALAFSEHLLGLSVVATPIEWVLRDPVAAANIVTLLTYPLCGVAVLLLVRRLTGSLAAAFLAGLAFAFSPYRAAQMAHVQMLAAFWAPLALLALHGYLDSGRRWWLALYGAAHGCCRRSPTSIACTSSPRSSASGCCGSWSRRADGRRCATSRWRPCSRPFRWRRSSARTSRCTRATVSSARHEEAQTFSADLTGLLCAPAETALWGWLNVGCRPEGRALSRRGAARAGWTGDRLVAARGRRRPVVARPSPRAHASWPPSRRSPRVPSSSVLLFGPWRIDLGFIRASASAIDKPLLILVGAGLALMLLSRTGDRGRETTVGRRVLPAGRIRDVAARARPHGDVHGHSAPRARAVPAAVPAARGRRPAGAGAVLADGHAVPRGRRGHRRQRAPGAPRPARGRARHAGSCRGPAVRRLGHDSGRTRRRSRFPIRGRCVVRPCCSCRPGIYRTIRRSSSP